jgi:(2Fe-2S) ferredoxin
MSSYYDKHVFFCCNQRDGGRTCCADKGASALRDYAKGKVKALGLSGEGKVRINQAGCLDRCEEGPCIVVYPDAVWYAAVTPDDARSILDEHLIRGRPVERLRYDPPDLGAHKLARDEDGRPIGRPGPWPAGTNHR